MSTSLARALSSTVAPRTRLGRRLLVRFSTDSFAELAAVAERDGLSLGAAVRHLVELGLAADQRRDGRDVELLGLAAVLAAEHGVQLLEGLLPDGRMRSAAARELAVAAAQVRLGELRQQLADEGAR